tara:strand:- start:7821 stop:9275 length:1455 start_codon:yes stop_codon:yes gene_type:complete
MVGITSFGGYVPRLRLQRQAIVDAHSWADPGLAGRAKGERSMCNWDEDAVTMCVEAGRACLEGSALTPEAVYFASTSAPFADRQHAAIVSTALGLSEEVAAADISSSQRAGTTALIQACAGVQSGQYASALLVVGDKRRTKAASAGELAYGDAAAACCIGTSDTIVDLLAAQSSTVDFVDHFRAAGESFDYTWEERWIRDEGLAKIAPPCIQRALDKAGVPAASVDHFVMPSTIGRAVAGIARQAGINPDAVRDNLHAHVGEAGAAHSLVMLLHTLETAARPGDVILLVSFAQGCDAVVLKVTEGFAGYDHARSLTDSMASGVAESNYQKFLAFNDLVTLERGMRAEPLDYKTALSVTYRKRDMLTGLIGGRCTQCGTLQFPRTDICVNPQCHAVDTQEPHPFRDEAASILTWSADYLTYTPDPPSHYGMITFANGGRFMTDFTDIDVGDIEVGTDVRMVFRIKSVDSVRGFVRYFWKATPVNA